MPYATPADIRLNIGNTSVSDENIAYWIDTAELIIENRLGELSALDARTLKFVIVEAVSEKAKNPEGNTQISVSADGVSESKTITRASGRVEIRDEWWQMLAPTSKKQSKAFTVMPAYPVKMVGGTIDFDAHPELRFQYQFPYEG